MTNQPLSAIVAVARNGTIGSANALPWKLRSDLQRFKRLTMGHTLIMGRKTFESIGRPLPGRRTIVLSRQTREIDGVQVAASLEEAIKLLNENGTGFVVGGAEIYRLSMPLIQSLYLTRVLADIEGDAYFCDWDETEFHCVERSLFPADAFNEWPTEFLHFERNAIEGENQRKNLF